MEAFLKSNPDDRPVYAHNDDMGLGAIEAIEAAGKVPGKDIKIVSVDAVKDGMQALADGKINFIVECNPLLGPQLMDLARRSSPASSPEADRHRGDHLHPGAGQDGAAGPPVLIARPAQYRHAGTAGGSHAERRDRPDAPARRDRDRMARAPHPSSR